MPLTLGAGVSVLLDLEARLLSGERASGPPALLGPRLHSPLHVYVVEVELVEAQRKLQVPRFAGLELYARESLQLPHRLLHAGRGVAKVGLPPFGARHASGVLDVNAHLHHRRMT